MRSNISLSVAIILVTSAVILTIAPDVAAAAAGAPEPAASGAAGLITAVATAIAGLVTALCGAVVALRASAKAKSAGVKANDADARAKSADERSSRALAWADKNANAHADGVVLVLRYPGAITSSRALLEINGWNVCRYEVSQAELDRGLFLPGPHAVADVCAADAIVIEGLTEPDMARLSAVREFRDNIRSGASVVMHTAGRNHRYNLSMWGDCDQGVTTPVTCEAAVRASLARREATARRQGVRPGKLAAARAAIVDQAPAPATATASSPAA